MILDTNLTGLWLMCQKFGSMMVKQNYGRIINVSSLTGLVGVPANTISAPGYNASKGAVLALTRDLAVKWAKKGVTVNSLVPGWFNSDMVEEFQSNEFLQAVFAKINKYYIPVGRFGSNDELKTALMFLAAPGSSYVTGISLIVDGGYYAQ
jgi:gluconate 5-dehydrogenase